MLLLFDVVREMIDIEWMVCGVVLFNELGCVDCYVLDWFMLDDMYDVGLKDEMS